MGAYEDDILACSHGNFFPSVEAMDSSGERCDVVAMGLLSQGCAGALSGVVWASFEYQS